LRAVVIASGDNPRLLSLNERYPAPLLPLVDRPFLQHILEHLVHHGVRQFDFVLSHLPQKVEDYFGDGTRWGASIRFHLASDPLRPYYRVPAICAGSAGPVLLVHADRLPKIDWSALPAEPGGPPLVYCLPPVRDGADGPRWTGWAWLPAASPDAWPPDLDEPALSDLLLRAAREGAARLVEVPHLLSLESCEDYLRSQEAVLRKQSAALLLASREVEPGIWLDRNVSLHPTARLDPPVYIGENCRIGRGVHLGPNTVISRDCVVDLHSRAVDTLVLPGSYIGESLELDHVIVDRNRLLNVRLGASVAVTDAFLLGSLAESAFRASFGSLVSRLLAVVLLLLAWPVLLVTALGVALFRRGPLLHRREAVRLPAPPEPGEWRTCHYLSFTSAGTPAHGWSSLFLELLPALPAIAGGKLRFVGVEPRTAEQIRALPEDWRDLYLRAKAGLITEAFVQFGANPSGEERYSSEIFYAATAGFRHDATLVLGYLRRILRGQ